MAQFDVIPPLRWDNPQDVPILRHIEENRGVEMAELATLPNEDYLREVCELMAL
jgi:hypothetical protein